MLTLTPFELASGVVVGRTPDRRDSTVPIDGLPGEPLEALQAAIFPALTRPPCLVSFSGGIDSSFVLAVAVALARSTGLPDPIPFTWRIPSALLSQESEWQERVAATLGLTDWVREVATEELDLVGPVAARLLRRYGVLHPVNVHLHLPIMEQAAGGSVLTGGGGDQILSGWSRPTGGTPVTRLRRRVPSWVRARVRERRGDNPFGWLHPRVARRAHTGLLRELAAQPGAVERRVLWHRTRRDVALTCASLEVIAADSEVRVVNPLLDRGFVVALARRLSDRPPMARPQLLADIASAAIPALTYEARPKARFLEVFFRSATRALVSGWDGSGVDERLVDPAALQRLWSTWPIPPATAGLVQQVWLSRQPGLSAPQPTRSELR